MNGKQKGGNNGDKEGNVTPISPEVQARRFKDNMKAQFSRAKPEQIQLMSAALNEVAMEKGLFAPEPEKSPEEKIEELLPYEEPEPTFGSKFKGLVNNNVSEFSETPFRHLLAKTVKCMLPLLGISAVINGIEMWSDPAKQTTVKLVTGPFKTAWEAVTIASGFVYDNSTAFAYGAAAALALTLFNRPTVSKRFGRAFYAGLFASAPTVFNDLVTNMQNGASTIGEKIDLSFMGKVSIVALSAAVILSWITPKFPKHDEGKETSPKEPSKIGLALGAVTGGISWGIHNTLGALVRAPGKLISAVREKIASRKESVEPAPTEEMPAEMAPTPVTEEMGATAEEPLPETEEIESPGEAPEVSAEPEEAGGTTEDWHPASPELEEVLNEDAKAPQNGDILIPLDE